MLKTLMMSILRGLPPSAELVAFDRKKKAYVAVTGLIYDSRTKQVRIVTDEIVLKGKGE